jgi:hypothetical protein
VRLEDLHRLEALRSVAFGLGAVDNLRGAIYSARALRLALELGVPTLVAEALGTQAIFEGAQTTRSREHGRELVELVRGIAERHDNPSISAWLTGTEGILDAFDDVTDAPMRIGRAAETFQRETVGNTWNTNALKVIQALTLRLRGDFTGLRVVFDEGLREARRQNNRYMECTIRHGGTLLFLVDDDVVGARENRDVVTWDRVGRGMHVQHLLEVESDCFIALYEGRGAAAFRAHGGDLMRMFTSLVLRLQRVRVIGIWLAGTLACADGARWAKPIAQHCSAILAREGVPYADLFSQLLRTSIAFAWKTEVDTTLAGLIAITRGEDWPLYAHIAKLVEAWHHSDPRGQRESIKRLRELGVRDPRRLAALYVPGTLRD